LKRWEEAERVIEERLKAAEDHDALRSASMIAMLRGDYDRVIEIEKKVVARGEANSQDLNSLAWAALCGKKLTPEMIEAAQNSVKMGKAEEFGPLHTLAAVYAETGKTTEAREIMLHGMDAGGRLEPDSESWYVFGRIAEEYGLHETALADYRRVEKESEQLPSSTWELAQKRIATLARDDKSHD
jgi:tetratricopeptide (TPR) repeat protein